MFTNIALTVLLALMVVQNVKWILSSLNPKKRHFEARLKTLEKNIWDKDFEKFQTLEIREGVRLDRDKAMEKVDAFETELLREHKPETIAQLTAQRDEAKADAARFEAQIGMLDREVNGKPYVPAHKVKNTETGEETEVPVDMGQQGITDTIASLSELKKMFVSYLQTL